ncbi:hypothetical protein D3C85_1393280 [compost metagenome]
MQIDEAAKLFHPKIDEPAQKFSPLAFEYVRVNFEFFESHVDVAQRWQRPECVFEEFEHRLICFPLEMRPLDRSF